MCPKSGASVSPSPVEVLQSNSTGIQSQITWRLLPLLDPQAGKPDVRLKTFTLVRSLLWYSYFPVCEPPTYQVWDLILCWLCPSYSLIVALCVCVCVCVCLDVGYLFFLTGSSAFFFGLWLFSSLLWLWCFHKKGITYLSTLPSWTNPPVFTYNWKFVSFGHFFPYFPSALFVSCNHSSDFYYYYFRFHI